MLARSLDDLYFSQSALIAYQTCPLKFRRRYLDGLFWPADWGGDQEQRAGIEQGQTFHLLAQRYYSRGELPSPGAVPESLKHWFDELTQFRPYMEGATFLPEHELRLNDDVVKMVAKYDLLYITPDGRAIIYDWKTNASRPLTNYWRNHLQTIVYRYVFLKAGGVYGNRERWRPEDLTMLYWNPRFPKEVEPLIYTQAQFASDEQLLRKLIHEIRALPYDQFLATGDQQKCRYCEYTPVCHGNRAVFLELEKEDLDFDLDWETIEGVIL